MDRYLDPVARFAGTSASSAASASLVGDSLDRLAAQAKCLAESVSRLRDRLGLVLLPEDPRNVGDGLRPQEAPKCPLVERIESLESGLAAVAVEVSAIHARLAL